ncbi:MAG: efflux RND transporter periplasmic adaptor subunit [Bacillota bacterium]
MGKKFKTVIIIAVIIFIGIGAVIFINRLKNREPQVAEDIDLGVPVETTSVERTNFEIIYNYSGTAEYLNKTKISPRVSGEILELYVKAGEKVEEGQLLAKIDDQQIKNNLDSARTALTEAEIAVEKAKLSKEIAENNFAESRAALKEAESDFEQWKSDYERDKKLFEKNAIAEAKFEQTRTQYKKAQARLDRIQSSLNSAEKAVSIAELDIKNTEQKLIKSRNEFANAEIKLNDTEIRSPLDGKILGEFIEEGEFAAAAQTVLTAAPTDKIEINVNAGMKDLEKLKVGSKAVIYYPGGKDNIIESEISEIALAADPVSRTTKIKIPAPNTAGKINDGMSLAVGLVAEQVNNTLSVPNKSVFNFKSVPHVYVINENTAERRQIETGLSDGNNTAVVSGLTEGEKIALTNINELRDNIKVYLPDQGNGDD